MVTLGSLVRGHEKMMTVIQRGFSPNAKPFTRFANLIHMLEPKAGNTLNPDLILKSFILSELSGITGEQDLGYYFGDLPSELSKRRADLQDFIWGQWKVPTKWLTPSLFLDKHRLDTYGELKSVAPPIIIQFNSKNGSFDIADGNHRVETAKRQGADLIACHLGIRKDDVRKWIIDGDPALLLKNMAVDYYKTLQREILNFRNRPVDVLSKMDERLYHRLQAKILAASESKDYTIGVFGLTNPHHKQHRASLAYFIESGSKKKKKEILHAVDLITERLRAIPNSEVFDAKAFDTDFFDAFDAIFELETAVDTAWVSLAEQMEFADLLKVAQKRLLDVAQMCDDTTSSNNIRILFQSAVNKQAG